MVKQYISLLIAYFEFLFPDRFYLKIQYFLKYGKCLNLQNPKMFSEKMQWMKLYNRNDTYSQLVDKYEAKIVAGERIGDEHIIKTYAVWDRAEDIDFTILPNQFVLKCTHDSGTVIVCKNKTLLDQSSCINRLHKSLQRKYYNVSKEWPYKNVKPRIIAEKLISDPDNEELIDYKFYCFNGKPRFCQVIKNRHSEMTIDMYGTQWELLPFTGIHPNSKHLYKQSLKTIEKPKRYDEMLKIASILTIGLPFCRIDLYNINGEIYFGEYTFFPMSGYGTFIPENYNQIIGNYITLPEPIS